jgi:hypothetical protein
MAAGASWRCCRENWSPATKDDSTDIAEIDDGRR